jgi:hypothetical protein
MEAASRSMRVALETFTLVNAVDEALMNFVRQLEIDYEKVQDITLFIFALRSFFCWHRANELLVDSVAVKRIRHAWLEQNENTYTRWLTSANDNHERLKWAKWTFQAKNSILNEFLITPKA